MSANPSLLYGRIIQREVSSLTKPHTFIWVFFSFFFFLLFPWFCHFSAYVSFSSSGDSPAKQMSPASHKKGKHGKFKRQKSQRQCSDGHSSSKNRNSLPCEKRTNQKQLFSPSEVSYLSSSSLNVHPPVGFPAYSNPVSTFPAPSGGEQLALRSVQPQSMSSSQLYCGTQSYPVFYPPNIGTFMAVFFQGFPMYAQMPQHVFLPSPQCVYPPSSYPCTTLPPAPPPCAPSPAAPQSVDQPFPASPHSSVEDQQEGQCEQALLLSSSRSSSPLQLNLLQEELPKPMELSLSADLKPHAEDKCVSNRDFSCGEETFPVLCHQNQW